MIQKCLGFLAVTTTISQIVIVESSVRRRRYFEPSEATEVNPSEEPLMNPPWWQDMKGHKEQKPLGSYGHDTYEFNPGGYGSGESSSEEDRHDSTGSNGSSRTPGYGGQIWWRPPPPPTKRPRPPPNSGENIPIDFLALCVRSCPVTTEFNPVCGSNKVTYQNPSRLECEQNCGVAVTLSKLGPCHSSEQIPERPVTESQEACTQSCIVTEEYRPVCGSNNITYSNFALLECAQSCGIPVTLSKLGPCSEQIPEKPVTESQEACMQSCIVTEEYRPVCGSNNITYSNFALLECAQSCGIPVTVIKFSACTVSEPALTTTENILSIAEFTAACMQSCPDKSEFNPVCGSDNITYYNPGRLECAQQCGVDVNLARNTSCEVPLTQEGNNNTAQVTTTESNQIPTSSSTTARPYINTNTGNDSGSGDKDVIPSNNSVNNNVHGNYGPIANEKNVTSVNDLNNSNKVNNSIHKDSEQKDKEDNHYNYDNNVSYNNSHNNSLSDGNNSKEEQSNSYSDDKNISESTGQPTTNGGNSNCYVMSDKKPPSVKEVMACMQTCTLTSESNPVCGTDLITYMNPGRLLCAQFCGVDVKLKKFAPCSSNSMTNVHCLTPCTNAPVTEIPTSTTAPMPSIEACMEACPSSIEFKPVCGNNNITYRNLEKLQCARRCGIDVKLKRSTHCSAPDIEPSPNDPAALIQECIQQCSVPQKYEPICGTDNVTYNNTGHLICARQCGLDIEVKQSKPCGAKPNATTTPPTITTKNPIPNGLNFTIDPSILDSIWSENTSPKPNDDDDDFELDQRVQDRNK